MASFKNQHFVPKCYLKAFSANGDKKSINVFNLARRTTFTGAPIKNQCSADHFYGTEAILEQHLSNFEGLFSQLVAILENEDFVLDDRRKDDIRIFCLLQHRRTQAAAVRFTEAMLEMGEVAGYAAEIPSIKELRREAVLGGIRAFLETYKLIDDLKVVLVRNSTNFPFITSDDPAILANRLLIRHSKSRTSQGGIGSAGLILIIPLTPSVLCLIYDGCVYSVPNENGCVYLNTLSDVFAFNQHQFLNCYANIYFNDDKISEILKKQFEEVERLRPRYRHEIFTAVLERRDDWGEHYKVVPRGDFIGNSKGLVHIRTVAPIPGAWPSVLKWRSAPFGYSNGSGVGIVRKRFVEPNRDYRKVKF